VEPKFRTAIEEQIFYPAYRGKIEDDTLDEAYVEHDGAKVLIDGIEAGSPKDDFIRRKVKVLSEITHDVKEEEMPPEGMFVRCRKVEDAGLLALRDTMLARKKELMAQEKAEGLPPAQPPRGKFAAGLIIVTAIGASAGERVPRSLQKRQPAAKPPGTL
jgi:hypothetical protein